MLAKAPFECSDQQIIEHDGLPSPRALLAHLRLALLHRVVLRVSHFTIHILYIFNQVKVSAPPDRHVFKRFRVVK